MSRYTPQLGTESETPAGDSPGAITIDGQQYAGGKQQDQLGADGNSPGGGGSGVAAPKAAAGAGAAGAVWFCAQQTVARATALYVAAAAPRATAGFSVHAPEVVTFTRPGSHTFIVPWWCNALDVTVLAGGCGGNGGGTRSSRPGENGFGGPAGRWADLAIVRGADVSWNENAIKIIVGDGGIGGIPGGTGGVGGSSSAAIGSSSVVSSHDNPHIAPPAVERALRSGTGGGVDPHPLVHVLVGGASQPLLSSDGMPPSGGGAGGKPDDHGGNGAPGAVVIRAYQK